MKTSALSKDIVTAIGSLSTSDLKIVRSFVFFLKTKGVIDPAQAYFWTRAWQNRERLVSHDKKSRRIFGDGTPEDLIRSLHS